MAGLTIVFMLGVAYPQAIPQWACTNKEALCHSVFIVYDSWHAAIVLPRNELSDKIIPELADFPSASFIEFSWGDKDYFPDPQAGAFGAIKAALWSSGSVMHLVGFTDTVENSYRGATVTTLRLNETAYGLLIDYINDTFTREKSLGRAPAAPGLFPNSHFYPANRSFSLLRTCNTWVAEALEQATLPISSAFVITAGNLHRQLLATKPNRESLLKNTADDS
jgi:uncharacterized protein (TIGR02117 family)